MNAGDIFDRSNRERIVITFVTCDYDDRPHELNADDRPCRNPQPLEMSEDEAMERDRTPFEPLAEHGDGR